MKRLAIISAMLLLIMGTAVVFWPSADNDDISPSPGVVGPIAPKFEPRLPVIAVSAPKPVSATIAGGVHRHGKGVAGARVIAKSERDTVIVTTGEGGGFLLTLPPNDYLLSATSDELASPVFGPFPLNAGDTKTGVTLELLASATIEGVVLNEQTREPIAQAKLMIAGGGAQTNGSGRFALKGVSVGEAWIEVSAKGFMSRVEWVTVEAARRLSGMEIVLTPAATVKGVVTRTGQPVAGARVWAEGDRRIVNVQANAGRPTSTDASGAFELEVATGKWQLAAAAPNEGRVEGPLLTLAAGGKVEGVQIELGQQLAAIGVVTLDAAPAPNAELTIFEARTGKLASTAVADSTGRFQVTGLPPGTYLVQARVMDVDAQRGPFQLTGSGEETWEVVLERAGAVRGRVVPPKAGTRVSLRSSDWVGGGADTTTDAEGRFLFEGVTTESTVEAEGEAGYAKARARPNQEVVLTLEQAVIKGSVVNEHGRAVTDFAIRLRPLNGGPSKTHAVLSPTGRFTLAASPGDYEVSAFASGSAWAEPVQGTAAPAGKAAEVNLKLNQTTSVSAQFVDSATRLPIAAVDVQARVGGAFSAVVFATTVTDGSGRFKFTSVPLSAGIVAFAPGYKPKYLGVGQLASWMEKQGPNPVIPLERGEAPEWLRTYEGIGVSWGQAKTPLTVDNVFPGSPAEAAGIIRGDVLLSVQGRPAAELSFEQIIDGIRGPAGTAVRLGFVRNNVPYEVSVRRRAISL